MTTPQYPALTEVAKMMRERTMRDGLPRWYDEWRTRSPEDEEDIQRRWEERRQAQEEAADYERDRRKDEPNE